MMKKSAFINSKFIIFIGLLLIIVSFTIPKLIKKSNPVVLRDQFFVAYGYLSRATEYMKVNEFNFNALTYKTKNDFVKSFASYFETKDLCIDGDSKLCLKNDAGYGTLLGDPSIITGNNLNAGQFVLANGMLIMMQDIPGELWIYTDINGINVPPNRLGVDLFAFVVNKKESELKLIGEPNTTYQNLNKYCNPHVSGLKFNGYSCSYAAALNRDYFADTLEILKLD